MSKSSAVTKDICYAARSDVGMKRAENQDAFVVVLSGEAGSKTEHRFVVADGMGAHAAGELASQLAVESVNRECAQSQLAPRAALQQAFDRANATIYQRGQEDTQLYNMGTTCSTLIINNQGALVAHVGDSRVYRCRDGQVQQLTFDHSLVWEMRAAGQLSDVDRLGPSIPRNVITRCLGPHPEVDVDLEGHFSVRKGDIFLLCSDGLTGNLRDEEIGAIMQCLQPDEAVDFLVDLANLRGGSDNITVIIARVLSDSISAAGEVEDERTHRRGATHPAWWLAAGAGLILALICYQVGYHLVALGFAAVFLLSAVGAAAAWVRRQTRPILVRRHLSPYTSSVAKVDDAFFESVMATFESILASIDASMADPNDLSARMTELRNERDNLDPNVVCQRMASLAAELRNQI